MKSTEEIKNLPNLSVTKIGIDGGFGEIFFNKWRGSIIWSIGYGWEHISVCPHKKNIIPSWDDMCRLKDMFFYEDEVAVQFHPRKQDYVNVATNCLHLWRCIEQEIPTPPKYLV